MTLDIIVICVIIVAVLLGYKIGFLTYVVRIASIFTGLLLTIVLVNPITDAVMDSSIGEAEIQYYVEKIENSDGYAAGTDDLSTLLVEIGVPSAIASIVASMILTDTSSLDFVETLAEKIATLTTWIKVFIMILIISTILTFIIKLFIKTIRKWKAIKFIDGVLGVVLSLLLSAVCGCVMISIIIIFTDAGFFATFTAFMDEQYNQSLGIYSWVYDHNFVYNFFALIFGAN